jgi:formylglycine-generating enzyme required for sulfatase activity
VKSKGANEYGLYDTRGNVWEWTRTRYGPSLNSPSVRAKFSGLDTNGLVLRGGSWRSKGDLLDKTTRGSNAPRLRDKTNGFRVVLAPAE